jgi:hypothetical protein
MGPAPGRDFFISCTASGDTGLPVPGVGAAVRAPGPAGPAGVYVDLVDADESTCRQRG